MVGTVGVTLHSSLNQVDPNYCDIDGGSRFGWWSVFYFTLYLGANGWFILSWIATALSDPLLITTLDSKLPFWIYGALISGKENCLSSLDLQFIVNIKKQTFNSHQGILFFLFYYLLKNTDLHNLFSNSFDTPVYKNIHICDI